MVNPRRLQRRRRSIANIRKITRTMELIATARFKRALERVHAASAYTQRITRIVQRLATAGLEVSHPLLEPREEVRSARVLVLTSNRGLCGGYNANVLRAALPHWEECQKLPQAALEVSGKRGISFFRFRQIVPDQEYLHLAEKPTFDEVERLAEGYLEQFTAGELDRLDVVYTRFLSTAQQQVVVETLLPMSQLEEEPAAKKKPQEEETPAARGVVPYEFLPSAASILEQIVPVSFKTRLFKCFLDAVVSEQIARMVAMKAATENAEELLKNITRQYNRARQSRITSELLDVMGGVEALRGSS